MYPTSNETTYTSTLGDVYRPQERHTSRQERPYEITLKTVESEGLYLRIKTEELSPLGRPRWIPKEGT